jgi:hypothetical protein
MSNLKLFFFVVGICGVAVFMALTLTAILEIKEGRDD